MGDGGSSPRLAPRRHPPALAPGLPDRGEHHVGVVGIQGEIHHAGLVALEQGPGPALAAVDGPVDAPLGVLRGVLPEGADPCHVAILRVDANPGDVLGLLEAQVLPGHAPVGGLVDAVPLLDVAPDLRLPGPDVHDVGIRLADRHGPHRGAGDLPVGDGAPREAAVGGLPQAAARGAEVVLEGPGVATGHTDGSAASGGAHAGPVQGRVEGLVVLLCGDVVRRAQRGQRQDEGHGT